MHKLALRARNLAAVAGILVSGLTCTDTPATGPRSPAGHTLLGLAPALSQAAAEIYRGLQAFQLQVNNIRLRVDHANGQPAKDTVVFVGASQDSVVLELTVPVNGTAEDMTARVELRSGDTVLFSGTQIVAVRRGVPTPPPPALTMNYTGPGATVAKLTIAPADTSILSSDSLVLRPLADGQSAANLPIVWSLSDPNRGTISSAGVFKPSPGRGATYAIGRLPTNVKDSARINVVPVPSQLLVVSGSAQTGTVGLPLALPVVIEARAADNLPVPGATVSFSAPTGGGSVAPATMVTDAAGRAAATLTLGTTVGSNAVQASVAGVTPVSIPATAIAGKAAQLAMSVQPSATAASGSALATQPQIQVRDAFGNNVAAAGIVVTGSLTATSGRSLGGTLAATTNGSGVAAFTNLKISGPPGTTSLTMAQDTLASAVSTDIDVQLGPPAQLSLDGSASASVVAGSAIASPPSVVVTDAGGNGIAGVDVQLALADATTTLATLTLTTGADGRVSLAATPALTVAGTYTATLTNAALGGSPVTVQLTVTPAAASKLIVLTAPPANANSGETFATQPVVRITDAFGNVVVVASPATVSAGASAGYALSGTTTVTAAAGVATFGGLGIAGPSGSATITFTSTGLASASSPISVSVPIGPPASLTTAPNHLPFVQDTVEANVAAAALPSVVVKDAAGHAVPGASVKFERFGGAGGGITGSTDAVVTATTGQDGVASLGAWRLPSAIGIDTVVVTADGVPDSVVFYGVATNGMPHHLALLAQPSDADAATPLPVVVALQDRNDNLAILVTGTPPVVALAIKSGTGDPNAVLSAAEGSALSASVASGVAAFVAQIDKPHAGYQLVASATGFASVETDPFEITRGDPAQIVVIQGDGQGTLKNATLPDSIVVAVQDAAGNLVPGAPVEFSATGGGSVSADETSVSDAAGRVGRLWTVGGGGPQTLVVTAGSATAVLRAFVAETLTVVTQPPSQPNHDVLLAPPPAVQLTDRQGNAVRAAGVSIEAVAFRSPADQDLSLSLSGEPVVTTNASGIATWTDLAVRGQTPDAAPLTFKLNFQQANVEVPDIDAATSNLMTLRGGLASALTFSMIPSSAVADAPFTVTVTAQDTRGNSAVLFSNNVTLSLWANPHNAHLSGTLTVQAVNGVATFSNLSIDVAGEGNSLRAIASEVSSVISETFDVAFPGFASVVPSSFANPPPGTGSHTCGLTTAGSVYCWGSNGQGGATASDVPFGDPCLIDERYASERCPPMRIADVPKFSSLEAGSGFTCGLTSVGAAWCWGAGTGGLQFQSAAGKLPGDRVFTSLSAGADHACGIEAGTALALCWGENGSGRLGTSEGSGGTSPTYVAGSLKFAVLSAGEQNTCGITAEFETYCWGNNSEHQLGDGSTGASVGVPSKVLSEAAFTSISVGGLHVCALTADGTAYCWGRNGEGQLGDDSEVTPERFPVRVATELTFTSISAAHDHTCAVATGGLAYCWGTNGHGQLGNGSYEDSWVPVPVSSGLRFASVRTGYQYSCGVTTADEAYCWGNNNELQGSLGAGSSSGVPVRIVFTPPDPQ